MAERLILPRRKPRTANVGVFGVGHRTYWGQFDGLLRELLGYHEEFKRSLQAREVRVVDFGMIDTAEAAFRKLKEMQAADLDLVFANMLTYATSSTWGILVRDLRVPLVMVALQPLKAMDYARGSTYMQLCNDNICAVPEFANAAVRMGKRVPDVIVGHLRGDARAEAEIAEWCDLAKVLHDLKGARIGHFGHPIEAMLDMHADQTALTAAFGLHVVQTEIDDLLRLQRAVTAPEVAAKREEILRMFDTPDPKGDPVTRRLTEEDLEEAARAAAALDRFVDEFRLDGLAYYYQGEPGSETARLAANLIVGNSLLTARGFPMCGESDLKTCVAMLILDRLDIGGSFAEFHPMDFAEDFILVGHDGPHHINIAEGRPVLRSLIKYHGKPGAGASVEFKIREGPITLLGVTSTAEGRFKFVVAEGESVRGPIPPTGNTNTRGFFRPDARTFFKAWVREGPTHHFALGVGHRAETLRKLGEVLGVETVVVTGPSVSPPPGA